MICPRYFRGMTRGLERWYGGHDLHFITCSCYRRRPELDSDERRDLFLRVLGRARQKYRFVVIGYVVGGPGLAVFETWVRARLHCGKVVTSRTFSLWALHSFRRTAPFS